MPPRLTVVWRLIWPGAVLGVIGVVLLAEGDALARAIGIVFIATWLVLAVRSYRQPRTKAEVQADRARLTRGYHRSAELSRQPRLRLATAAGILVAALAGAAYLHWHQAVYHCPPESLVLCSYTKQPSWANPAALAICVVGISLAAGLLLAVRRSSRGR